MFYEKQKFDVKTHCEFRSQPKGYTWPKFWLLGPFNMYPILINSFVHEKHQIYLIIYN